MLKLKLFQPFSACTWRYLSVKYLATNQHISAIFSQKIPREIRLKISLFQQFSEDGILSKLWAEIHLISANLILILSSHDSANLRNFKKTENFQNI